MILTKILYKSRCSNSFSKTCHNQTKNNRSKTSLKLLLPRRRTSRSSTINSHKSKTNRIFNKAIPNNILNKLCRTEISRLLKILNCSKRRISICLFTDQKWAMIGLMVPLKTIIRVNTTHSSHLCKIVAIEIGNQTMTATLTSTITERMGPKS